MDRLSSCQQVFGFSCTAWRTSSVIASRFLASSNLCEHIPSRENEALPHSSQYGDNKVSCSTPPSPPWIALLGEAVDCPVHVLRLRTLRSNSTAMSSRYDKAVCGLNVVELHLWSACSSVEKDLPPEFGGPRDSDSVATNTETRRYCDIHAVTTAVHSCLNVTKRTFYQLCSAQKTRADSVIAFLHTGLSKVYIGVFKKKWMEGECLDKREA